jgi:hypothetical protein
MRRWLSIVSAILCLSACDGAPPSPDASVQDGSVRDASVPDASVPDASVRDGGTPSGSSLRFEGNGRDAIDRVVIPIDSSAGANVGAGDFTIELFVRMRAGENPTAGCRAQNDGWIEGHTLLDRDTYGDGDLGDFGLSVFDGILAFGLARGSTGVGLCGSARIDDEAWHHVAITREGASGRITLFVDGRVDATVDGPTGDVRYRVGRTTAWPFDSSLVIGAEKHDAGDAYPSFAGWVDELRLSTSVRYREAFTPPREPFVADAETAALYHFDEGEGLVASDETGQADGALRVGGEPVGPTWSSQSPW